ncbi:hypothetical protein ATY77_05280 [Rhizobium sp. R634]|uniref:P-loop NTPase fold protein n=1 Tax=Rhizobium sp. R634 TaxID=1764274 RepID=UPI000B53630E|nr:P-loop NTPase fold protein [Rhizobium sp. R634]OWV75984.1 hypothetical protein ATY77_05280 [Rhizobium sp. R634]
MSVKNVRSAIETFLSTSDPQVLCISGAWGTGKTFNWKSTVRALRDKPGAIALNEYAYVSLFGLNSIAEVKTQILQSMVVRAQIGDTPDLTTFSNMLSTAESGLKKGIVKSVTGVLGTRGEALVSAMGFLTNRMIICLDDFERKGEKLRASDVMGLMTYLKEERSCKIVLLLNDSQLEDRKTYDSYLEKVVDIHLRFEPTAEEIGFIALPDDDELSKMVRERAMFLGISNVRVIRKVHGLVKGLAPLLKDYAPIVTENAVSTVVLMGWSYFEPEVGPDLEYLKRANTYDSDKEDTDLDLKWRDLLRGYRFGHADKFDLSLLRGSSAVISSPAN